MEKLSGLVLDVYDDQGGEILQAIFPSTEDLPDLVKTAHAITPEERGLLPDDAFALVLVDGDVEMKKFATLDEGNTALSVEYFLRTGYRLPAEAQKVAAHNLCVACGWYGIEPPEDLQKVASKKTLLEFGKRTVKPTPKRPWGGIDPSISAKEVGTKRILGIDLQGKPIFPGGSGTKTGAVKEALSIQKMKKNLDDAPDRPAMIPLKTKEGSMHKEAIGALGMLTGALVVPHQVGEAKRNLQATKGAKGRIMTPDQIKARSAQMGGM